MMVKDITFMYYLFIYVVLRLCQGSSLLHTEDCKRIFYCLG